MSTLAICGINRNKNPIIFSENSLNINQYFQNEYEYTKFKAEQLLRDFVMNDGSVYIYRSGNVSGHSETGKFQYNAQDNRFIQFLTAIIKLGKFPTKNNETIVLSPVDKVASGIVAISLDQTIKNGVYHVESDFTLSLQTFLNVLMEFDIALQASNEVDFVKLFSSHNKRYDSTLALGHFWASRTSRNVIYDNSKTISILKKYSIQFSQLDESWVRKFLLLLIESGVITNAKNSAYEAV